MQVLHLVRHGEVANPNHVVYADLPGFSLSRRGVLQAHATGKHLSARRIDAVISSPLQRAVQTATAIARHHSQTVRVDERLIESGQYPLWTGERWDDIHTKFPHQLATYLEDATALTDVEESIHEIADRTTDAAADVFAGGASSVVLVSHQDPVNAAFLSLTGRPLSELRRDPPSHASVVSVTNNGSGWSHAATWEPPQ